MSFGLEIVSGGGLQVDVLYRCMTGNYEYTLLNLSVYKKMVNVSCYLLFVLCVAVRAVEARFTRSFPFSPFPPLPTRQTDRYIASTNENAGAMLYR